MNDVIRLSHMLEAARALIQMMAGITREDFTSDIKLHWAATRGIGIIGEAAARISDDMRRKAPLVPWSQMIGMRNILVHAYFNVDLDMVFDVVNIELPELIPKIEALLAENSDNP